MDLPPANNPAPVPAEVRQEQECPPKPIRKENRPQPDHPCRREDIIPISEKRRTANEILEALQKEDYFTNDNYKKTGLLEKLQKAEKNNANFPEEFYSLIKNFHNSSAVSTTDIIELLKKSNDLQEIIKPIQDLISEQF